MPESWLGDNTFLPYHARPKIGYESSSQPKKFEIPSYDSIRVTTPCVQRIELHLSLMHPPRGPLIDSTLFGRISGSEPWPASGI